MKLEDGKSYGFSELFANQRPANVDTLENLQEKNADKLGVLEWMNNMDVLSYVCRWYISKIQTILNMSYVVILPITIILSILISCKFLLATFITVFISRLLTYLIQCDHPFIKQIACMNIRETTKIVNEYFDNYNTI